jgi:hypothetical protein
MLFTIKHIIQVYTMLYFLFKMLSLLSIAILHRNITLYTGRILLTFKHKDADTYFNVAVDEKAGAKQNDEVKSHLSHFLPTSRRIMQFSNGQAPSPGARVVYIDGAFDLFHAGHVEVSFLILMQIILL